MDDLLKALKEGDEEQINIHAQRLFVMHNGQINRCQVNEFERYAPCSIFFDSGKYSGGICYNNKTYMLG